MQRNEKQYVCLGSAIVVGHLIAGVQTSLGDAWFGILYQVTELVNDGLGTIPVIRARALVYGTTAWATWLLNPTMEYIVEDSKSTNHAPCLCGETLCYACGKCHDSMCAQYTEPKDICHQLTDHELTGRKVH